MGGEGREGGIVGHEVSQREKQVVRRLLMFFKFPQRCHSADVTRNGGQANPDTHHRDAGVTRLTK